MLIQSFGLACKSLTRVSSGDTPVPGVGAGLVRNGPDVATYKQQIRVLAQRSLDPP
jgi:hypothetical protein